MFRFQDATTTQTHNARSMCCNSILIVEPEIISRALDIQDKSPPGMRSFCSLKAASLPHSAAPPRATSECRSSNTSGPIPQTALQEIASTTADKALTPRFAVSSKPPSCRIVHPVRRRAFKLRRASRIGSGAGSHRNAWAESTSVGISAVTCSNVWFTKLQLLLSQQLEH